MKPQSLKQRRFSDVVFPNKQIYLREFRNC